MKTNRTLLAIGFLGVVIGMVVRQTAVDSARQRVESPVTVSAAQPPAKPVPSPEEIARPHLIWADQQSAEVLEAHLRQIDVFFADAKQNTPAFADRALSFSSKWRLVADHVPFTRGGRHEAFLRSKFEQHIFKPAELGETVEQVVASYLAHIRSIEAEMLVKVRADVADFSETYLVAQLDEAKLLARYDEALSQALAATGGGLRSDVATQVVSLIVGEVLTQVATRLGVSAGILGTGAASSWATFGIGLAVGLIVDQIVCWVWEWYADPSGNLARQLADKLDGLNRMIVDGSDEVQGLRSRLKAYASERAGLRESAVLAVLQVH
jgi:hypothetical protein